MNKKEINNNSIILKDLIQGYDENFDLIKNLNFNELSNALDLLINNPNLSSMSRKYLIENKWKINYRTKPPDINSFLTKEWIGTLAKDLFPYLKQTFKEFFNPINDYRHLLLVPHIGWGKSYLSVLINLYITIHLWSMRNPMKYFGVTDSTNFVQILVSFTEDKAKEVLLSNLLSMMPLFPKFVRCRTEDSLYKKQKDFGDDKICYTTAGIFAIQFNNNLNYKIASNPSKLLGLNIVSATLSELNFFIERGFSYDDIWRLYQDSKGRIYSRFKNHYWSRSIVDSSPLSCENSAIDKFVFSGEANKPDKDGKFRNYIITGPSWKWRPNEYKDINNNFTVFIGGNGKSARILDENESIKGYHPDDLIYPPVELRTLFEEDLVRNIRNYGGVPSDSPNKLITNYSIIDKIFDDSNLKNIEWGLKAPANEIPENLIWNQIKEEFFININGKYKFYRNAQEIRYIHIDQSESNDNTGISCGHVELSKDGEKMYIMDFTIAIIPDSNRINLDAISEFIFDLIKIGNIHVGLVTFDGFQSSSVIQRLNRHNINCKKFSVDSDMGPYKLLVSLIFNNRFKAGKNIFLKNNLKSLQETRKEKGRRKIDHTKGKSIREYDGNFKLSMCGINEKDLSDSVAGAIYHCINEYKGTPRYIYEPNSLTNEESILEKIKEKYNLVPKIKNI